MATIDIDASSVHRTPFPQPYEALSPEDFETASVRSAAPSYISEAPSYQSQTMPNEPAPPYTPRENTSTSTPTQTRRTNPAALHPSRTSGPAFIPPPSGLTLSSSPETRGHGHTSSNTNAALAPTARDGAPSESPAAIGLPSTYPLPVRAPGMPDVPIPSLAQFRIPTIAANPSARHYVRVAQRRAQAAANAADAGFAVRMLLERVEEEESRRFRPLEDPYLVGEVEARRARGRRVAMEQEEGGMDRGSGEGGALAREGRRWDSFLAQVREWDERDRRVAAGGGGESSARPRKHRGVGRMGLFGRR